MRSYVPEFEMTTPPDLAAALRLLAEGARPFAGGTDLMVELEAGTLCGRRFVNLWPLAELRGITAAADRLRIGALTTYTDLLTSSAVRREYPLLAAASHETGSIAIQNRGTLGGNLANASPAADSAPVLLVYDAEVELRSETDRRVVPYESFHSGYRTTALREGELIAAILLPRRAAAPVGAWRERFRKVGARRAQAIAKLSLAAVARVDGGVLRELRLAFGSMGPVPLRCHRMEAAILAGHPPPLDELSPVDDLRSTAAYRLRVARNLLDAFLYECVMASGVGSRVD
jgi:CO/xanthine dehydrogenase FAD-binding subunit